MAVYQKAVTPTGQALIVPVSGTPEEFQQWKEAYKQATSKPFPKTLILIGAIVVVLLFIFFVIK